MHENLNLRMERFVEFSLSQKGKSVAVTEGFVYHRQKEQKDGSIWWNCQRKKSGCSARIKTKDDKLLSSPNKDHNHEAEPEFLAQSKRRIQLLTAAQQRPEVNPSALINQYSDAADMGTEGALKRAIQRERRKKFPAEPKTAMELQLEGEWRETINGEDWVNGDLQINQERVLIFASDHNLRLLEVCDT